MAKIDISGVENVSVALIKQARADFIKGGKILYKHLKKIPTQVELLKNTAYKKLSTIKDVRWMYDAWRFVKNDPYEMFGEVGEETIIKTWTDDAIISHYKDLYLLGATILYIIDTKKKKEIYELADSSIRKKIGNKEIADNFINSRNEMLKLSHGTAILDEWNVMAFDKSVRCKRKKITKKDLIEGKKNKEIERSKSEHMKKVLKAKELYDKGMSKEEIAKELGVVVNTAYRYIREAKNLDKDNES